MNSHCSKYWLIRHDVLRKLGLFMNYFNNCLFLIGKRLIIIIFGVIYFIYTFLNYELQVIRNKTFIHKDFEFTRFDCYHVFIYTFLNYELQVIRNKTFIHKDFEFTSFDCYHVYHFIPYYKNTYFRTG